MKNKVHVLAFFILQDMNVFVLVFSVCMIWFFSEENTSRTKIRLFVFVETKILLNDSSCQKTTISPYFEKNKHLFVFITFPFTSFTNAILNTSQFLPFCSLLRDKEILLLHCVCFRLFLVLFRFGLFCFCQ